MHDFIFTNSQGPAWALLAYVREDCHTGRFQSANCTAGARHFAAMQHEKNGVSVNTLRVWLGHESLDVTLAYLKGSEAADEQVQEKVNNGVLAAFA